MSCQHSAVPQTNLLMRKQQNMSFRKKPPFTFVTGLEADTSQGEQVNLEELSVTFTEE